MKNKLSDVKRQKSLQSPRTPVRDRIDSLKGNLRRISQTPKPNMSVAEHFQMSMWEKWTHKRRFPFKFSLHLILLASLTFQAVMDNAQDAMFYRANNRNWAKFLLPDHCSDDYRSGGEHWCTISTVPSMIQAVGDSVNGFYSLHHEGIDNFIVEDPRFQSLGARLTVTNYSDPAIFEPLSTWDDRGTTDTVYRLTQVRDSHTALVFRTRFPHPPLRTSFSAHIKHTRQPSTVQPSNPPTLQPSPAQTDPLGPFNASYPEVQYMVGRRIVVSTNGWYGEHKVQ